MNSIQTLQPEYLTHLIKLQKPVTIYFKCGHKLTGILMGTTDKAIFFKDDITQYYYKENIYTILPACDYKP